MRMKTTNSSKTKQFSCLETSHSNKTLLKCFILVTLSSILTTSNGHTWNQDPDKRPKIEINTQKPAAKKTFQKYQPKLKETSAHTVKDVPSFIAGQTFGLDAENHQKNNFPDIGVKKWQSSTKQKSTSNFRKIVHLDLSGAPLLVSYIEKLVNIFKFNGVTTVLLEYRDLYTYTDSLQEITSKDFAYTRDQTLKINKIFYDNNIDIIPYIPLCTDMEYVLTKSGFEKYQLSPDNNREFNLVSESALKIALELITQVLQSHDHSTWVHVGCGRMFSLGGNDDVKGWMHRNSDNDPASAWGFFLSSLSKSLSKNSGSRKRRLIVWDDMLRSTEASELEDANLALYFDIMVREYRSTLLDRLYRPTAGLVLKYLRAFPVIWFAGAYKVTQTESGPSILVDIKPRVDNINAWLQIYQKLPKDAELMGIALMGMSRSSFMASLAPLFPVAVPSLIACLMLITNSGAPQTTSTSYLSETSQFTTQQLWDLEHQLGCKPIFLRNWPRPQTVCQVAPQDQNRAWPGHEVYQTISELANELSAVQRYAQVNEMAEGVIGSQKSSDPLGVNVLVGGPLARRWSEPLREAKRLSYTHIESGRAQLETYRNKLEKIADKFSGSMEEVYPSFVAEDWLLMRYSAVFDHICSLLETISADVVKSRGL